jgi:outer membrane protein TolC
MVRFIFQAILPVLLLICPVTVLGQSAAAASAETLTLEQAVALALRENPLVRKAALETEKTADRLAVARTRQLPSFEINLLESQTLTNLDLRFPKGIFGSYSGTGPIPSEDTTIGTPRQPTMYLFARAAQPLSQLHRIKLGLQLEEVRGEVEREKLRAERQQTVKEVKRIYYELLGLQSALEASEENLKLYRELDRVVGGYVVEKVVLKAEGLDVKAQLASEEYTSLTLHNALASQKEQLNVLLGRDIRTDFRPSPLTISVSFDLDLKSAQERALEQRPEVKEARLLLRQAELDRRLKRSQYIPDVSLAVTYMRIAPVSVIPPNIASAGVMLTWEPFDWGRKKRELAEKSKTVDQAQLAVRAADAKTVLEINALARKLQEARAMLRVTQLAQDAAREKMRVATNRFAEEVTLLKDVLQAQSAAAEAGQKYQQALLAFWKARAEFEKVIGEE